MYGGKDERLTGCGEPGICYVMLAFSRDGVDDSAYWREVSTILLRGRRSSVY